MFLFLTEFNNYVKSFVVGSIVVLFKYIFNKTLKICKRQTTLIFFVLFFVTYFRHKLALCGDAETDLGLFSRFKSISFYHQNLNGLLVHYRENFHLLEAFVVSNNIDIFCISETFLYLSADNIFDELNVSAYILVRN